MSLLILFKKLTGFFRLNAGKSRGLTLFFPVIILLSCGLPSYSYLFPPTDVYSRKDPSSPSNGQDLIFSNAYQNNLSIFSGYEVFYKVYDPLDAGTSEIEYSTDVTSVTNTSGADYNTLNSLGFGRLFFTTDDVTSSSFSHDSSKPAFSPDSNLLDIDYQIRFNLNQAGPYSEAATYGTTIYSFSSTPYIYRWVYDDTPGVQTVYKLKQFDTGSFDIYDSDLPDTLTSADLSTTDYYVYITFYVMSFGRDADDITSTVYSEPVYLGTLKFDCSHTDNFYD